MTFSGFLTPWTRQDEINLRYRIRRLIDHPIAEVAPKCDYVPAPIALRCPECEATNHGHRSAHVGPYVICRCLGCPVVTVEVAS